METLLRPRARVGGVNTIPTIDSLGSGDFASSRERGIRTDKVFHRLRSDPFASSRERGIS